ncbi:MAG: transglutaminase family protein [Gemmataceae bacterium]
MSHGFPAVLVLVIGASVAAAQPPTHRMELTDFQTVQATIGYELRSRDFEVSRWMAYIAEPPELPSQTKLKVTAEPAGKIVPEKSPLARKVRLFDAPIAKPSAAAKFTMKQDIAATLRSRKLVPLEEGEKAPAVPALTATERKFYLAATKRYDFNDAEFKAWLLGKRLIRAKSDPAVDYAARVLEVIRADYAYRFDQAEEKRASITCSRNATDCGGMTILFVAAMRAHDIPARTLVGRLAKPRREGSVAGELAYDQPHVRAEFHVPGIGWIPVDPTYANRDTKEPVKAFVGRDPGDLLVLHVDFDLRLPVLDKEHTTDLLQLEPAFWAFGRGKFDAFVGPSRWELKATPVK